MAEAITENKRSRTSKAILNFWVNIISQGLIFVCGILLPKVLIGNYGSDTNGLLNSINQVFVYAALIETGIGSAAINLLYRYVANKDQASINGAMYRIRRFYLRASILYGAVVIALSFLYPLIVKTQVPYWTIVAVMLLQGAWTAIPYFTYSPLHMLMQAEGKHYILIFFDAGTRIAMTLLKILLYSLGCDIVVVQLAGLAVGIIKAVLYYVYRRKKYPWVSFKPVEGAPELKSTAAFTISAFARAVMDSTDTILLSIILAANIASVYSVYALIFITLKGAVNSLLFGQFAIGQDYQTGKKTYLRLHDSLESFTMTMASAVMTIAACLAIPFLRLYTRGFTDVEYIDPLLPILFALIGILGPARSVCVSLISASKSTKRMAIQNLVEALSNIAISIPLIYLWGIRGALLATIIAMTCVSLDIYFFANRKLLGRMPWRALRTLALNLLLFAAFAVPAYFLDYQPENYLKWVFLALMVTVVVFTCFGVAYAASSPRELVYLFELFRNHMTHAPAKEDDASFKFDPKKKHRTISFPWKPTITLNRKVAALVLVLFGGSFSCFACLSGKESYQVQMHEKMLVLNDMAREYAASGDQAWVSLDATIGAHTFFWDVASWQSLLSTQDNYYQTYITFGESKEHFHVEGGLLDGHPIEFCNVANYSDEYFMEGIDLPLYRPTTNRIQPRGGAQYGCYIPQSLAEEIIASDDAYSTLDDFFDKPYLFTLNSKEGMPLLFSVNNIYINGMPQGMDEAKYLRLKEKSRDFADFFSKTSPNAIFTYASTIAKDYEMHYQIMATPSYTSIRDGIRDSVGLDYRRRNHTLDVKIVSSMKETMPMNGVIDLDASAYGESFFDGMPYYYVLPTFFFAALYVFLCYVWAANFRGRLIFAIFKCLGLTLWPVALTSFAGWMWGLVIGHADLLPLLALNVLGNGVIVVVCLLAFVIGTVHLCDGAWRRKKEC